MDASYIRRHYVAVMAKHLPPSSSTLRLLDLDGKSGKLLGESRADLLIRHIRASELDEIDKAAAAYDAVVAFDIALSDALLRACLAALREGGRLIALQSRGIANEAQLRQLRAQGYTRILVEPAIDELGVLIRGEKPHSAVDTLKRLRSVARADADSLDLSQFRGRYIHLLIQQRPNKPVWKLAHDEEIEWRAAAIQRESTPSLLGFSSLPKAVSFMQRAVLAGDIRDINKVGKFSRERAQALQWRITLNPAPQSLDGNRLTYLHIDPALAEAPDE